MFLQVFFTQNHSSKCTSSFIWMNLSPRVPRCSTGVILRLGSCDLMELPPSLLDDLSINLHLVVFQRFSSIFTLFGEDFRFDWYFFGLSRWNHQLVQVSNDMTVVLKEKRWDEEWSNIPFHEHFHEDFWILMPAQSNIPQGSSYLSVHSVKLT